MRVLTYMPHGALPDRRGYAPALVAYNLMRHLRFCRPYTICNREDYIEHETTDPVIGDVRRIAEGRVYRRLFRKITRLDPYPLHRRAARIAARTGVELVHAHQLEFPVLDFLRVYGRRVPVVVHAHVIRTHDPARGEADCYIAVSGSTRSDMIDRGYPKDRIEVVHNGVDTELFAPADAAEKKRLKAILGIPADAVVFGYVARKQEAKGFLNYLRAMDKLLARSSDVFALAVGPTPPDAVNDPNRVEIEHLVSKLGKRRGFLDLPALPHAQLASVYKVIDAVLAPTRGEQHPLALVEAMSAGCIAVTTRTAGIVETVEHGRTGILLSNPTDTDELLSKCDAVLADFPGFDNMRRAARTRVLASFDWRELAQKVEAIYFRLLSER